MTQWFAIQVKPRHEKAVAAALRARHFEEFLPLRKVRVRWSDRYKVVEMPLLAGYTFCRFDPEAKLHILRTPGVRKIVGRGATPVAVEEREIQALQTLIEAGLPAAPCAYLRTGQAICLERGPLSGLRGLLLQTKGRRRLVVSITLLQRSVAVEVEQAWISPANLLQGIRAGRAALGGLNAQPEEACTPRRAVLQARRAS